AKAIAAADDDGTIDGVLAIRFGRIALGTSDGLFVEPEVRMIELDPTAAPGFGADPKSNGLSQIPMLGPDDLVVNADVAKRLGVSAGDQLNIYAGSETITMNLVAVLPETGLAGLGEVITATGAVTSLAATLEEATIGAVLVSNRGGVYSGADLTDEATELIMAAGISGPVDVDDVKRDLLRDADFEAADTTELFGTIGGFSVVAGILLVVNLFVMVAEERKTELGTLRAVGLSRSTIRRSFTLEGFIYGLLTALAGALLGIVVSAGVLLFANSLFSTDADVVLSLSVAPLSLLTGALIGLAISQITVTITSARITRLNIIRALKDLPEPRGSGHPRRNSALGALGMVAGILAFLALSSAPAAALLAPVVVALSSIPLLSRILPSRYATVIGCALGLGWAAAVFGIMSDTMADPAISIFLIQGVLLVGLAVTIVAALDSLWVNLTGRLTGGRLAPRLGMAHPLARPVRSALLVAMYGLVIFTVTFMAVLNSVFQQQAPTFAEQAGGSFDLYVDSNSINPWTEAELTQRADIATATPLQGGRIEFIQSSEPSEEIDSWRASSLPVNFPASRGSSTTERAGDFATDTDVWKAVVSGDSWIVVPVYSDLVVGEEIVVRAPGLPDKTVRVAATTDLNWLIGSGWYVPEALEPYFTEGPPVPTRHFVIAADGSDRDDLALALNQDGRTRGSRATTFLQSAQEEVEEQEAFLRLLQGYLGLGLLIGIAGLGVVLVRAVRERRRELGMMKAMGISSAVIRNTFMVEAGFIGVQGVLLGIGLGLLSAWQVLTKSSAFEENLTFAVPVDWLLALTAIAVLASLGAGVIPALRAARTTPAVALRVSG
ncbi:MAG: FtsX-like permease family protein, partial [Acidimicrobiales bacterium]